MRAGKLKVMPVLLVLALMAAVLAGCRGPEVLPVPPAPPPASIMTTSSATATFTPPSSTGTVPTTETTPPGPATSTVETAPVVTLNEATVNFPDRITFSIAAKGPEDIKTISLQYGTDKRTLAPETQYIEPEFTPGKDITTSWEWQMKKTGSIPPGATLRWTWKITDVNGQTTSTPEQSIVYGDTRFDWQIREHPDYEIYWHDQAETLINDLLSGVESRLSRIQLDVAIPKERKPKVFIYRSSDELKGAVLFEQGWTGAIAYPSFNIILTAVSSDSLDWAKGTLPHEITHLLVGEATFGPFGNLPLWLDEGLAEYAEGEISDSLQNEFDKAVRERKLISVQSLASAFPVDPTEAYLAYAESASIVSYLVGKYGWDDMHRLLDAFKEGATNDAALLQVYSVDVAGLEAEWKKSIGA